MFEIRTEKVEQSGWTKSSKPKTNEHERMTLEYEVRVKYTLLTCKQMLFDVLLEDSHLLIQRERKKSPIGSVTVQMVWHCNNC